MGCGVTKAAKGAYMRRRYAKRRSMGLCLCCNAKSVGRGIFCTPHKKEAQADDARRRAERKRKGVCKCGKPVISEFTSCASCTRKRHARTKRQRAERKTAGSCLRCNEPAVATKSRCTRCMLKEFAGQTRRSARVRNLPVAVSDAALRFIAQQACHYCGGTDSKGFNGIDRKNNSRGYVRGNMLPCCWTHNNMRGALSYSEFVAGLQAAAKHLRLVA